MFRLISHSIHLLRRAKESPLQSFRYYNSSRFRWNPVKTWPNFLFYARKSIKPTVGGFLIGAAGIAVATETGLSFDLKLKFSPKESIQNNLKAIVVSLLMCERLTKDEVDLMTSIVEALPTVEASTFKREKYCENEMINFMKCTEKFGGIRSEKCCNYRSFLKSCLQAKTHCQQVQFSSIISFTQNECPPVVEFEDATENGGSKEVVKQSGNSNGDEAIDVSVEDDCCCECTISVVNEDAYEEDECEDETEHLGYSKLKSDERPLSFLC